MKGNDPTLEEAFDFICEHGGNLLHKTKLSDDKLTEYNDLLSHFKQTNSSDCSTGEKGKSLESLVSFLFKNSLIFNIHENLRTSSNELDIVLHLNQKGQLFKRFGWITSDYSKIIGECKNYEGKVGVTYVGKFCTLVTHLSCKIGVMFSYNGMTGNDKHWSDGKGLAKKIHLKTLSHPSEDTIHILDFSIKDFESISSGYSLVEIINAKITALELDASYDDLLISHDLISSMNMSS